MQTRLLYIFGLVLILLALFLSSCVTTEKQVAPELLPMTDQEIPGDVKLAAATVVTRLNGYVPTDALGISFKPGDWSHLDSPEFDYAGFIIKTHQLYQYAARPNGEPGRLAAGRLTLEDLFGRTAQLDFMVEYVLTENGVVIEAARAVPVFAAAPRVEICVVPTDIVEKEMPRYPADWVGLYVMAKRHNVLEAKDKAVLLEKKRQILFVFLMDRTAPSAKTNLRIADQKESDLEYGWDQESDYLNFNGFPVAMAAGKFPAKPEKPFWIKLALNPGKEAGGGYRKIIFHEDLREIAAK